MKLLCLTLLLFSTMTMAATPESNGVLKKGDARGTGALHKSDFGHALTGIDSAPTNARTDGVATTDFVSRYTGVPILPGGRQVNIEPKNLRLRTLPQFLLGDWISVYTSG